MQESIWQGERVRLRSVEPEDWRHHFAWDQGTEDARHSYFIPFPNSMERAKRWAQEQAERDPQGDDVRLQIETRDGVFVGTINTVATDRRTGTFSYGLAILPQHRRKGYASEAIRLLVAYFFDELRYQKCTVQVYSFNTASIQLHERLGFHQEGHLRRMIYTGGAFHDTLYFGITR